MSRKRAIKFRAWDPDAREFGYLRISSIILLLENPFASRSLKNKIWEQYTGLKDEDGEEIYEGDIIKIKQGFYAVVWDYLRAAWGLKYLPKKDEVRFDRDIADMRFMQNNSGLVIGNIHENPELLKNDE